MSPLTRIALVGGALGLGAVVLTPATAYAHGFGERYDLPVPLWLYVTGAGAAVALSFVVIGLFMRGDRGGRTYPRVNLLKWLPFRLLSHPLALLPLQLASVGLFLLVVVGGLVGEQEPTDNAAPVLVWILWWVGLAYVSALVGNVWAILNPWKIIFTWVEWAFVTATDGKELNLGYRYPVRFGVWPALILFWAFAWIELVYVDAAIPAHLARLAINYSVITWAGMIIFGRDQWLRHGEAFTLVFGFLAKFAPTELRTLDDSTCRACPLDCLDEDGLCIDCHRCFSRARHDRRELNLRPFAAGLLRNEVVSTSMAALVVLLLSTVTYDGLAATPLWASIHDGLVSSFAGSSDVVGTLGLLGFPLLFGLVYLATSWLIAQIVNQPNAVIKIARTFVYSLIPIALAYHLAHFLSFLLIQGQLAIPLASDPLGMGWDLFGTTDYQTNLRIINARTTWLLAVVAIVVGHIISVFLAHSIALRTFKERRLALRSQLPMLALMVGYTMVSLWILAQPITESS